MAPILMHRARINSLNSTSSLSTWDKFRQRQAKLVDLGLIDSSAAEGGQSSRGGRSGAAGAAGAARAAGAATAVYRQW